MGWPHRTPGIPDGMFERAEGVPITKEEVRAVQVCKARLSEGCTVHDIGCGSGSVTVEAALQAGPSGRVHAVDVDGRAVELTRANLARFGIRNAEVSLGEGSEAAASLPPADAVFVGGTCGGAEAVIRACAGRLRPGGRIVVAAILVETASAALGALAGLGMDADVTQVAVSKGRRTSTGTMLLARNPVTILSASAPG